MLSAGRRGQGRQSTPAVRQGAPATAAAIGRAAAAPSAARQAGPKSRASACSSGAAASAHGSAQPAGAAVQKSAPLSRARTRVKTLGLMGCGFNARTMLHWRVMCGRVRAALLEREQTADSAAADDPDERPCS
jgi:hypothetical protein